MRILIVGLGAIGQRHVRNLRELLGEGVEILACRTRRETPELSDRFDIVDGGDVERSYGVIACDDLDAALARRPDATFVCNPTALHLSVARTAAEAGSHLFVEKPLSHSWEGVDELIELVDGRRLAAMVGFQMRFHPCLVRLRDVIREQSIGRVIAARIQVGEYLPGWHPYEDYRTSYASRRELGGGVILTQIHELDSVLSLFGMPRRLFAVGGHLSRLEIDVEDTASILLECLVDGRTVPVHVQQDYLQRPPARTCEVIGDAGKVLVDLISNRLDRFDDDGRLVETLVPEAFHRNLLFLDELRHFLACVAGTAQPIVSLRDGAASLRIALAAVHSMDSGRSVEVTAGRK